VKYVELAEFLVLAKTNTYAKGTKEKRLSDGSKELVYADGEWEYKDTYSGEEYFLGKEIVLFNGKIVWTMDYSGGMLAKEFDRKKTYAFLRKALLCVNLEKPFRGPESYSENEFEYKNRVEGGLDRFSGEELICFAKKNVYSLKYGGGLIKQ